MYPWKTVIHIDSHSCISVYVQIANSVINEIIQGRLQPGQKLPGSRIMAELLEVNRKTAMNAYDELMTQGWIEINASKGAFVSESLPIVEYKKLASTSKVIRESPKETWYTLPVNDTLNIFKGQNKKILTVNGGSPDTRLAPIDTLYKNCRSIAQSRNGRYFLNYGEVQGNEFLRETLAAYLQETRGLNCSGNNVMITRGSQMALYLSFLAILRSGDHVIVGDSNYPEADLTIRSIGGKLIKVKVDEKGLSVDEVEKVCKKVAIRAIFVTSHHHYPTTVTLSVERRLQLLKLAEKYRFAIIEDDYDYDFHYTSSPILPLGSHDCKGSVVYIGSFAKTIAPSIRIGYIVAPNNMILELIKLRRIIDRQGDPLLEAAIAEMLREGEIQRHLKKALKEYKSRRDFFTTLLSSEFPNIIDFNIPEGGMAVWAKFNKSIKLAALIEYLEKNNIYLSVDGDFVETLNATRLGFASLNKSEISLFVDAIKGFVYKK